MSEALAAFLGRLEPPMIGVVMWGGDTQLEVSSYIHPEPPPLALVTSIRAVVVADEGVAVLHNANGSHILPGGRREPGESVGETLRREVLEETGCEIVGAAPQVGFVHFHHLTPRPDGYEYPYPDFLQIVCAARGRKVTEATADEWEDGVEFLPADVVRSRRLESGNQLLFLDAALDALGP